MLRHATPRLSVDSLSYGRDKIRELGCAQNFDFRWQDQVFSLCPQKVIAKSGGLRLD